MINKYIYSVLLILCAGILFGQNIANVERISIHSKALSQQREILVYTPIDYDYRKNEYFNVVYVFDSQNREFFDYTSSMISFLTDNGKSFIVVGITSPYYEDLDYARNNDFLPILKTESSKERYGKYSGGADKFMDYVGTEVISYIESHYRTLSNRIAVGHSLGASFILYSFVKHPDLFNNYIAISPNLAYDNNRLAEELMKFDYSVIDRPTYIYLSNANEGIDYWNAWKGARDTVYTFYTESLDNKNITVQIGQFPEKNHWNTFPPSLNMGLEFYFQNIFNIQERELSQEEYEVTIKAKVPNKDDTLFITGNQESLGNWEPDAIKMNSISEFEREIKLTLKSPAQFKFTRGNWDTEAEAGSYGNITIKPEEDSNFEFVIEGYFDSFQ